MFKYKEIQLLSELDELLWNNTSIGEIYTFGSPSDYDKNKHPFAEGGLVEVKRLGGYSTFQVLYDLNASAFIRRRVAGENWGIWKQL